jgi:hypothetical protein
MLINSNPKYVTVNYPIIIINYDLNKGKVNPIYNFQFYVKTSISYNI